MANYIVANPTSADITSGALTVKAGKVVIDTTDAVAADIQGVIDAGCCVASASKSTLIDGNTQLVEKGARLLGSVARAAVSASGDSTGKAQAGV